MRILSATVDRLGTQMLLSGTYDIYTVQALEILLAHEPSLIGTSVCGGKEEQASRGNGLAGESLLTSALSISREIGLDKSVSTLKSVLTNPKNKIREGSLAKLLVASSLWISLRIWEGHYIFVKSTIRPMRNLNELAEDAKCMISIDERGDKVEAGPFSLDKYLAGTVDNLSQVNDETLRSAGRTMLAYRIQSMALFQDSLSKIQDIAATGKEEKHGATPLPFRDSVADITLLALQEMVQIEQAKQQSMTPFAWHPSATLVEEWSKLESHSVFSILCTFSTCAIYTGRFDGAFSAKAFVEDLKRDSELRNRISTVGSKRMEITEGIVASFSFFNRRLNIAATADMTTTARRNPKGLMEVTGAPIFLTCAFVADGCRMFLEATAFILMAYFVIDSKSDSKLLLMIQAAQRLDEFDGNTYYSERSSLIGRQAEAGEEEEGDVSKDAEQPQSICRVTAMHVREMAETVQKWKLASSIYQRRRIVAKERLHDDKRDQGKRGNTENQDRNEDPENPSTAAAPAEVSRPTVSAMATAGATATQATLNHESVADDTSYGRQLGLFPVNSEPVMPIQGGRANDVHINSSSVVFDSNLPQQGYVHYGGHWPSAYPGRAEAGFPGYTQAPLAYLPHGWHQDADLAREYGSVEQLLSGAIPDSTQHITGETVGGIYDLPLFDWLFENPAK
ncbi:hypothetical protein BGZ83_007100 [Gryganskiella cystojenkinii]|nr:hypothetical protein BGZ83_007100 [Gryganskiella cystojenkinii]